MTNIANGRALRKTPPAHATERAKRAHPERSTAPAPAITKSHLVAMRSATAAYARQSRRNGHCDAWSIRRTLSLLDEVVEAIARGLA